MARYTGADCKRCRREKTKLFLKGAKCESPKCPIESRPYPPGQHGRGRTKDSEYLLQKREKQKCARIYGVLEKQFRGYYEEAQRKQGKTGENLLRILESRLDNVVYRAGFAASRDMARQLVRHGHITVNGHTVTIPSYQIRIGDVIRAKNRARSLDLVRGAMSESNRDIPDFLSRSDSQIPEGIVGRLPAADDVSIPVQTQLIVELCSR